MATSSTPRRLARRRRAALGHVAAATCTEAGMLATLALLQGGDAERFLAAQGVQFWALR